MTPQGSCKVTFSVKVADCRPYRFGPPLSPPLLFFKMRFLSFKPLKFSLLELVLTFTKKRFKIPFRDN
jgi:hypothetical protein